MSLDQITNNAFALKFTVEIKSQLSGPFRRAWKNTSNALTSADVKNLHKMESLSINLSNS